MGVAESLGRSLAFCVRLIHLRHFIGMAQDFGGSFVGESQIVLASYMAEFASCWGILVGSMLVASPVIFFKVKDSTAASWESRRVSVGVWLSV
jgi:hypothetical protein